MLAKKIPHPVEPSTLKSRHRRDRHVRQVKYDTGWGTEALQSVNPRNGEDARRGPWSTEGGQYLEKIKQKSREALFCLSKRAFPRAPISTLGTPPPQIVPERTKVWRNGTCLTGNPNIEIGGRGKRHSPISPEDIPELSQQLRSVPFSKFCPPTGRAVAFLPKKSGRWRPPWPTEMPTAQKPHARRPP